VLIVNIVQARKITCPYLKSSHQFPVTLASKVMDVGVSNPHNSISGFRDSGTKLYFVRVVGQLLIEAAELFPETPAYEERKPSYPR